MSPIKRSIQEEDDATALGLLSPKRLRGGGGGGDDDDDDGDEPAFHQPDEEELFDEDLILPTAEEEEDIPPEVEEQQETSTATATPEQHQQRWKRPALPTTFDNSHDLNVQWIDMDVVTGKPLTQNPNRSSSSRQDNNNNKPVVGVTTAGAAVPILRCFGVNEQGHSVTIFLHGFTPYCYFALPAGYELVSTTTTNNSSSLLEEIRLVLQHRLQQAARGAAAQAAAAVVGVEYVTNLQSIMGYETQHTKFLKVYVSLPGMVPTLKRIMEEGIDLPGMECVNDDDDDDDDEYAAAGRGVGANMSPVPSYAPFECNVPFVLRFMVDRNVTGAGWLTLPARCYQIRDHARKETHCQVRVG